MSTVVMVVLVLPWLVFASVMVGSRLYYGLGGGRSLARHHLPITRRHLFAADVPASDLVRTTVSSMDRHCVRVVIDDPAGAGGIVGVSSVYRGQLLTFWFLPGGGSTFVDVECTPAPRSALFGQVEAQRFANGVLAEVTKAAAPQRTGAAPLPSRPA